MTNTADTSTSLSRLTSALTLWTRTNGGVAMRPKSGKEPQHLASESYYIESAPSASQRFSCSFVEFDGMGDYLLFEQHQDAWEQTLLLAKDTSVLLVIYCHGWQNNSQSADVLRFNAFLCQLASTEWVLKKGWRVHGVYLAWRGASMKPDLSSGDDRALDNKLKQLFGTRIVDLRWSQWLPAWAAFVPQQLTYWGRKTAAENDVSGAPISRTVFSLGYALKRHRSEHDHHVILIGHSMGALMMEQSLANACMSKVMADWPWFSDLQPPGQDEMVLPFDVVLLLNSAAPSIYAKEMRDFLAADYAVRKASGFPRPDGPVIISVTSEGDLATGVAHRIGNAFSFFSPKLQRAYADREEGRVYQSSFYSMTPGHNPLLINRQIKLVEAPPMPAGVDLFEVNRRPVPGIDCCFYTSARHPGQAPQAWCIERVQTTASKVGPSWRDKANYWIISVPKALIRNHGDIWSQQSMEMMVGLWRIADTDQTARIWDGDDGTWCT